MKNISRNLLLSLVLTLSLWGQTINDTITYTRSEILIPMRDGIKLNALIYTPNNTDEPMPILFSRTPYGVSDIASPEKRERTKELAKEGYIFVYQDLRGRYKSDGTFEMLRLTRNKKDSSSIDESTDTYDTIEWLVKNIPNNNGNVGMFGVSYAGWTTMMGTLEPHPALKAASEQATPSDMYIGDDFFHNGAFRLSYAFEYAFMEEFSKTDTLFPFNKYDTYEWYLDLGPLSNVNNKYFFNNIPSWNNFITHPNYDDFWEKQSLTYRLDSPLIPILHVAGWWDQEDFYGPLKAYEVLEKKDNNDLNRIVIGPWNHGGWNEITGDKLGNVWFGKPTAQEFRRDIQAPFFAYYLKGKGDSKFFEAITFQTGSNTWEKYDMWPPENITKTKKLYFHCTDKLSFEPPDDDDLFDEYISDPSHPVPYRLRPVEPTYGANSRWENWLVEDQRFVHNRPDVLSWTSEILTKDIIVTGNLLADIFASTTGTDADWVVKLIDVYPEVYPEDTKMGGYQLMIANDVFRGRFRNSYVNPEPVEPNKVYEYKIDLHSVNHVFKAGHKVMVQIQSSWFPIIDRNPQKFIPNIFDAKETDFIVTKHRVYQNIKFPSHIVLPIVEGDK